MDPPLPTLLPTTLQVLERGLKQLVWKDENAAKNDFIAEADALVKEAHSNLFEIKVTQEDSPTTPHSPPPWSPHLPPPDPLYSELAPLTETDAPIDHPLLTPPFTPFIAPHTPHRPTWRASSPSSRSG